MYLVKLKYDKGTITKEKLKKLLSQHFDLVVIEDEELGFSLGQ